MVCIAMFPCAVVDREQCWELKGYRVIARKQPISRVFGTWCETDAAAHFHSMRQPDDQGASLATAAASVLSSNKQRISAAVCARKGDPHKLRK